MISSIWSVKTDHESWLSLEDVTDDYDLCSNQPYFVWVEFFYKFNAKTKKKGKTRTHIFYPTQSINIILKNDEISPLVTIYKVNGYII